MSALPDMDDMEDLWDNSKDLLIPGVASGAASAGLGAYLTSKKKKGETPSERRQRVVRNALIGAAAGTTAGVAIPAGARMLQDASSGGVIGDTIEDLITNTAILGTGAAAGYAGGTWAKDKVLNQAGEIRRLNTSTERLYNLMKGGTPASSMSQALSGKPADKVKDQLRQLSLGSSTNATLFYREALERTEKDVKRTFTLNETKRLIDGGMTAPKARQEVAKLLRKDSVKTSITMQAESSLRRTMTDIGLSLPEESMEDFLKRLVDPKRWSSRADAAKRLLGMKGFGDAGRIWGSMPTDSGRWKSILRRMTKGTVPGVGLAAGGLLASNFI